jgi:GNAT superfamily N-acetyltransferase
MQSSMEDISHLRGEYRIERLSKNNLTDLTKLFSEVYNKTSVGLVKKYDTAFAGIEYVGFIAYDKNAQPVAYYGVMPCFIEYGGEKILSAQSGDTMTHPLHRNRGLFAFLSNMTFDLCKKLGIRIVFGFPNQNSYPTMIKRLGWIETEKLNRFRLPLDNFLRGLFNSSTIQQKTLSAFLSEKKGLSNSVIGEGWGGVYRDKDYINYKSFSKTYVLNLSGAEIWVKIGHDIVIGDIKLSGNGEQFFKELKFVAKKLGVKGITFQASPGCSAHDLFAQQYQAIPSFPVLFKDFGSGIPLEKIKFTFSDIDTF